MLQSQGNGAGFPGIHTRVERLIPLSSTGGPDLQPAIGDGLRQHSRSRRTILLVTVGCQTHLPGNQRGDLDLLEQLAEQGELVDPCQADQRDCLSQRRAVARSSFRSSAEVCTTGILSAERISRKRVNGRPATWAAEATDWEPA